MPLIPDFLTQVLRVELGSMQSKPLLTKPVPQSFFFLLNMNFVLFIVVLSLNAMAHLGQMEVSSEHRGSLWGLRSGRSGPHRLGGIFVRIRAPGRKHSIHLQCLPKLVALRELRRTVGAREFLCGGGVGGARRGNYLFISKSGSYNFCTCVLEFLTVKVMEKTKNLPYG